MQTLKHPNVVSYIGHRRSLSSSKLYLYMEWCGNGDLHGLIQKLREHNKYADESMVWNIIYELVKGIHHCHLREYRQEPHVVKPIFNSATAAKRIILHRDIKPENGKVLHLSLSNVTNIILLVFLSNDNVAKLGDFGLSTFLDSSEYIREHVGTPPFMCPEIYSDRGYSTGCDIWALGCTIHELCTRKQSFTGDTAELARKVTAGSYQQVPSFYSSDLCRVIDSCLQLNPRSRTSADQLMDLLGRREERITFEVLSYNLQRQARISIEQLRHTKSTALTPVTQRIHEDGYENNRDINTYRASPRGQLWPTPARKDTLGVNNSSFVEVRCVPR
jgi:serine/threonine protein kinase